MLTGNLLSKGLKNDGTVNSYLGHKKEARNKSFNLLLVLRIFLFSPSSQRRRNRRRLYLVLSLSFPCKSFASKSNTREKLALDASCNSNTCWIQYYLLDYMSIIKKTNNIHWLIILCWIIVVVPITVLCINCTYFLCTPKINWLQYT